MLLFLQMLNFKDSFRLPHHLDAEQELISVHSVANQSGDIKKGQSSGRQT